MTRHQFSYWLDVSAGPNSGADWFEKSAMMLEDRLRENGCLWPEGPLVASMDIEGRTFSGQVNPDCGTVEECSDIEESIAEALSGFPGLEASFREIDEEDRSVERLTLYKEGIPIIQRNARIIPPDRIYDPETVTAISGYLSEKGLMHVADSIRDRFLEK